MQPPLLVPAFFLTALLYASAGFGGGSTYLALLALSSFPFQSMPQLALICNLAVVTEGFYAFAQAKHFSLKRALPFVVTSVPAAYLGGLAPLREKVFLWLLTGTLLLSGLYLLFFKPRPASHAESSVRQSWTLGLPAGAVLGALAGLLGIGGGIFLAPLLYLTGWGDAKQIAATCSFFILVNSASGLFGQWDKHGLQVQSWPILFALASAVLAGGFFGSRLGARRLPKPWIQTTTALLILFVALRLLQKLIAA